MPTHEVTNQPPPLVGYDASDDPALRGALSAFLPGAAEGADDAAAVTARLAELGRLAGGAPLKSRAGSPTRTRRSSHASTATATGSTRWSSTRPGTTSWRPRSGTGCTRPRGGPAPGAHLARAAGLYVWGQAEAGHLCPVSMTYAIVPALRHAPDLARQYEPLLAATEYDPSRAAAGRQAGPDRRHVDDGEAGRLRRPGQHHDGSARRRTAATASPATSGSPPPRWATSSWSWPRRRPGRAASCCPRSCPTAPATRCTCSGSRTSWATARTPPPRSSTTTRPPGSSVRRAAASAPSSTWSTPPAWTACWPARPACAWASSTRPTTPATGRRSAASCATSR